MPTVLLLLSCTSDVSLARQCMADEASPACVSLADRDLDRWLPTVEARFTREETTTIMQRVQAILLRRNVASQRAACDAGDVDACFRVALCQQVDFQGCDQDLAVAARTFRQLCDQGHILSCGSLGLAYLSGDGVPKDELKAISLLRDTCPETRLGCGELSRALWRNQLATVEEVTQLAIRACERDRDGRSCTYVGCLADEAGAELPSDKPASWYFARACDPDTAMDAVVCLTARRSDPCTSPFFP